LSTSAPARATRAATSWPKARPAQIEATSASLTGQYLSGAATILVPEKPPQPRRQGHPNSRRERQQSQRSRRHAAARRAHRRHRVSGSGKSTPIVTQTFLYRALAQRLYRSSEAPARTAKIIGSEHIDKVIEIDQAPI